MDYRQHFNTKRTAQSEPIPGENMVQNNAGGFAFTVDRWKQLERFLILGSEGGTYYVGEHQLTVDNAKNVVACIQEDGPRTLKAILEISKAGRAPKNDPALFALALCASLGDDPTRRLAFELLPQVARIGTHLLHFANFMEGFRGWGRAARRGIADWFLEKEPEQLGYQFIKYAQRDGWSMRDLLRLSHPQPKDDAQNALFKHIISGELTGDLPKQVSAAGVLRQIAQEMKVDAGTTKVVCDLILEHRLPREAVPTEFLNQVEVWEALLQSMPMTAMIRNLGKMTQIGLLAPMSAASRRVVDQLTNEEALRKARVHPITILSALKIYNQGCGFRGKLSWSADQSIVAALDQAFYLSFGTIEPTGKRMLLGLDVSGSMGASVIGLPFLNCYEAEAAMAMATARSEREFFTMGFSTEFKNLGIHPSQRLDDVLRVLRNTRMGGGTDCSIPMMWALKNKVPVDVFVTYTDNETWYGDIHPAQALRMYRDKMGIPAKMVSAAFTATEFTICPPDQKPERFYGNRSYATADPNDAGTLDVAGLDSSVPNIISDFVRG